MGQGLQAMLLELVGRRVEKRVVLLGLDNAGKTTCVYRLLLGRKVDTVPTIGFNSEEVRHGRCNFVMWDIGGQAKIRKLWRHYVESADALVFVVDAQDRARLREARAAFKRCVRWGWVDCGLWMARCGFLGWVASGCLSVGRSVNPPTTRPDKINSINRNTRHVIPTPPPGSTQDAAAQDAQEHGAAHPGQQDGLRGVHDAVGDRGGARRPQGNRQTN